MRTYKQFTIEQRYHIYALFNTEKKYLILQKVEVDKSTISRELIRNKNKKVVIQKKLTS